MATEAHPRSGARTRSAAVPDRFDDLSTHAHRQLIGYIGLLLPVILVVFAGLRPTDGLERWQLLGSISAYFYTGATSAFVGLLVALAFFLFTYQGYRNEHQWADRAAAWTGGAAALGVALYPTAAPEGVAPLAWWTTWTGVVHYVSAVVLFGVFAVFALWLFRLGAPGEQPTPDKLRRNRIYLVCGIVIIASVAWAGIEAMRARPIFLPESVALVAFAVSWLVKGYALRSIGDVARSVADALTGGEEEDASGR
jgi:hypothetical protein